MAAVEGGGEEPELAISNGGLDANWLTAHGIPDRYAGLWAAKHPFGDEELDIAGFPPRPAIALRLATGVRRPLGRETCNLRGLGKR